MTAWGGEADEIRLLVDDLAELLGRSVVVNDPLVRQIYGSRHFEDEDPVRIRAVLQHELGAEVTAHVVDQDIPRWPSAGRLPGAPALGLLPRWCVPLRADGAFLGTVMVIDADRTLTGAEQAAIDEAAHAVAALLAARAQVADARRDERDRTLRGLFGSADGDREAAVETLRDSGFPDRAQLVAMVVEVTSVRHSDAQIELALRHARSIVEAASRTPGLGLVTGGRIELVQHRPSAAVPDALREAADRIRHGLFRALGPQAGVVVGTGSPATALARIRASHRQAIAAVRAARRLPALDGVAIWDELGGNAPLLSLPDDLPPDAPAARALRAIDADDAGPRLRETLRAYLDHACSAPRTARALNLHRTTLYYRLNQIRELTGYDLGSGHDRFALQLQLRIEALGPRT
ncbi:MULTISPECIES: PucR family transcriptional regulator [Pseudonocardia]|uniref:Carbohydrate diacid regulator n=2 Tax=Pseudonocardia TaxID=1847 RepID=A0A1Y2MNY6_PSEAH|nr:MULTISPECIES: helix-turn-helix domain-containing protein [Pseudonocardia]OSY36953.1 Carbohydrate diacid regulator [Pseudonocardia autotrophica]TDN75636.1 PucR-like helix-turn-helix protein [Pseudonocardia autotrophica]BBF99608.1 transcriptional regulator [Pseudonocardia autotrophica]GEC28627.1 transcriptional regulator [Pseudonocardia saturnea]